MNSSPNIPTQPECRDCLTYAAARDLQQQLDAERRKSADLGQQVADLQTYLGSQHDRIDMLSKRLYASDHSRHDRIYAGLTLAFVWTALVAVLMVSCAGCAGSNANKLVKLEKSYIILLNSLSDAREAGQMSDDVYREVKQVTTAVSASLDLAHASLAQDDPKSLSEALDVVAANLERLRGYVGKQPDR